MRQRIISILWDDSHLWGIMAWRAMRAFGLPCRLVKSKEIAQGALFRKWPGGSAAILIVPGGSGRQKARKLGDEGRSAIRHWLAKGGIYIGFCGGAGLALRQKKDEEGLGICPWERGEYSRRLYHLLSGHVQANDYNGNSLELPIWWPGRFAPGGEEKVRVLARHVAPAADLWLADMPLAKIPPDIRAELRADGLSAGKIFPPGQPLVISGDYGRGQYLLSYAHPETPESWAANAWLCQLLADMADFHAPRSRTEAWAYGSEPIEDRGNGNFSLKYSDDLRATMEDALRRVMSLVRKGKDLGLFFQRASWLFGWKSGISGMACNNLLSVLARAAEMKPGKEDLELWRAGGENFCGQLSYLLKAAEKIFWDLHMQNTLPQALRQNETIRTAGQLQAEILGHPMLGGGKIQVLLEFLEELIWLNQKNSPPA